MFQNLLLSIFCSLILAFYSKPCLAEDDDMGFEDQNLRFGVELHVSFTDSSTRKGLNPDQWLPVEFKNNPDVMDDITWTVMDPTHNIVKVDLRLNSITVDPETGHVRLELSTPLVLNNPITGSQTIHSSLDVALDPDQIKDLMKARRGNLYISDQSREMAIDNMRVLIGLVENVFQNENQRQPLEDLVGYALDRAENGNHTSYKRVDHIVLYNNVENFFATSSPSTVNFQSFGATLLDSSFSTLIPIPEDRSWRDYFETGGLWSALEARPLAVPDHYSWSSRTAVYMPLHNSPSLFDGGSKKDSQLLERYFRAQAILAPVFFRHKRLSFDSLSLAHKLSQQIFKPGATLTEKREAAERLIAQRSNELVFAGTPLGISANWTQVPDNKKKARRLVSDRTEQLELNFQGRESRWFRPPTHLLDDGFAQSSVDSPEVFPADFGISFFIQTEKWQIFDPGFDWKNVLPEDFQDGSSYGDIFWTQPNKQSEDLLVKMRVKEIKTSPQTGKITLVFQTPLELNFSPSMDTPLVIRQVILDATDKEIEIFKQAAQGQLYTSNLMQKPTLRLMDRFIDKVDAHFEKQKEHGLTASINEWFRTSFRFNDPLLSDFQLKRVDHVRLSVSSDGFFGSQTETMEARLLSFRATQIETGIGVPIPKPSWMSWRDYFYSDQVTALKTRPVNHSFRDITSAVITSALANPNAHFNTNDPEIADRLEKYFRSLAVMAPLFLQAKGIDPYVLDMQLLYEHHKMRAARSHRPPNSFRSGLIFSRHSMGRGADWLHRQLGFEDYGPAILPKPIRDAVQINQIPQQEVSSRLLGTSAGSPSLSGGLRCADLF